jgi:glycosyltransferase involved in cell wall biosynthesis
MISDAWHPQVNGVVRALDTTARHIRDAGHEVDVLGPNRFRTVPLPTYAEIRLALTRPARVGNAIEDAEPDAVHIATEGPLGWMARAWLQRHGIPFTTSFHTMFPQYVKMRTGLPESVGFRVLRRFHNAGERTMVSTPTLANLLSGHGFARLAHWSRGVDTELFRPVTAAHLDAEGPIQLYVGRVAVEKNLEAFLKLDTPGTKYVVGEGPEKRELEDRYPEVRFVGAKYGDELLAHYCAADVFVFPSLTDTLGFVMMEALACGIPVAAFPVQGPVDVIGDSGAGVLSDDLASAVEQAVGIDPEVCRGRALQFSWPRSAGEFIANLAPITGQRFELGNPLT